METGQINQRIAVLNAESKRLNNERAVNIGKKETLQKQLDEALAHYKTTYGVELTEANLQSEINRVSGDKIKEIEKIETVLNLIKAGQYDEANALVNGTPTQIETPVTQTETPVSQSTIQTETPVAQPETPVAPVVQPQPTASAQPVVTETVPTPPVIETPVATPPVMESVPTPPVIETPVATPPILGTPVAESVPTPPVIEEPVGVPPTLGTPTLSGLDTSVPDLGMPPADPVAPQPSTSGQPIASFNAILGGSPFKPQGEI